jgi:hypothetical protein
LEVPWLTVRANKLFTVISIVIRISKAVFNWGLTVSIQVVGEELDLRVRKFSTGVTGKPILTVDTVLNLARNTPWLLVNFHFFVVPIESLLALRANPSVIFNSQCKSSICVHWLSMCFHNAILNSGDT